MIDLLYTNGGVLLVGRTAKVKHHVLAGGGPEHIKSEGSHDLARSPSMNSAPRSNSGCSVACLAGSLDERSNSRTRASA